MITTLSEAFASFYTSILIPSHLLFLISLLVKSKGPLSHKCITKSIAIFRRAVACREGPSCYVISTLAHNCLTYPDSVLAAAATKKFGVSIKPRAQTLYRQQHPKLNFPLHLIDHFWHHSHFNSRFCRQPDICCPSPPILDTTRYLFAISPELCDYFLVILADTSRRTFQQSIEHQAHCFWVLGSSLSATRDALTSANSKPSPSVYPNTSPSRIFESQKHVHLLHCRHANLPSQLPPPPQTCDVSAPVHVRYGSLQHSQTAKPWAPFQAAMVQYSIRPSYPTKCCNHILVLLFQSFDAPERSAVIAGHSAFARPLAGRAEWSLWYQCPLPKFRCDAYCRDTTSDRLGLAGRPLVHAASTFGHTLRCTLKENTQAAIP